MFDRKGQTSAAARLAILSQHTRTRFSTQDGMVCEILYQGVCWTALCHDNGYKREFVIKGKIDKMF